MPLRRPPQSPPSRDDGSTGRRRRLGPVWVTIAVAFGVAAATLVAGLAVQRVALSEPDRATFRALRAATWLGRYRLVESTFTVNGGPELHGRCLQDWFHAEGRRRRGAELLLDVPPHTLLTTGGTAADRATAPLVLLELAGCPRVLERRVETLAQQRRGLTLSGTGLGFVLKGTHVVLTLDRQDRPVGVRVTAAHVHGASTIRFARVTPAVRQRFLSGTPFTPGAAGEG